ncbi:MAG TPA: hypothetical protein VGL34_01840 [Steroidobacteraceae bacterium]
MNVNAQIIAAALLIVQASAIADDTRPPDPKTAWKLLFENHNLRLSGAQYCNGAGTDEHDETLGDYLSGFLSQLHERGNNRIKTLCVDGKKRYWTCDVTIGHEVKGTEDVWTWGVRFHVSKSDGKLISSSVMCTGAG